MTAIEAGVVASGFALGTLPTGYWVVRRATGKDIRRVGSGNVGATNVYRVAGSGPAAVTFALDACKGAAAVGLAGWVAGWGGLVPAAAGLAAVLGHVFNPWLGFRGGKGSATAAGVLLTLAPVPAAIALALFGVLVALFRRSSIGSLGAAAAFPVAAWARGAPTANLGVGILLFVLLFWTHRENLGRLLRGEEPPLWGGTG